MNPMSWNPLRGEGSGVESLTTDTPTPLERPELVNVSLPGSSFDFWNGFFAVDGLASLAPPPWREGGDSGSRSGGRSCPCHRTSPYASPASTYYETKRLLGRRMIEKGSAPPGGPPRTWTNADLKRAAHSIWKKQMTTAQASRQYAIPYNFLLKYLRGKGGKTLIMDWTIKELNEKAEQPVNQMEESQNLVLQKDSDEMQREG